MDSTTMIFGAAEYLDGGFIVTGAINPGVALPVAQNMLVGRVSATGEWLWSISINGSLNGQDQGNDVVVLPNGDLRIIGWTNAGFVASVYNVSAAGSVTGSWHYQSLSSTRFVDGTLGADGSLLIAGQRYSGQSLDAMLVRRLSNGDTAWVGAYGDQFDDMATSVVADSSTGYYLAGYSRFTSPQYYEFFLAHIGSNGSLDWYQTYGTSGWEYCYGMTRNLYGDLFLAGSTRTGNLYDGYLAKINAQGTAYWRQPVSNAQAYEVIRGVASRPGGGVVCAGYAGSSPSDHQCWLILKDVNGGTEGSWTFGPPDSSGLYGVTSCQSGGWLAFGAQVVGEVSKGYLFRLPSFGGVQGVVTEESSGERLAGVVVRPVNDNRVAVTDAAGHFILELDPGLYDLTVSGACVESDTVFGIDVPQGSSITRDLTIRRPRFIAPGTSINLVAQNHVVSVDCVYIFNDGEGDLYTNLSVDPVRPESNWIRVVPASATVVPGDSLPVQLIVDADTANTGVFEYFAYLRLHTNSCPDTAVSIPIIATVLDAETPPEIAGEFSVLPAYPNPFNPSTSISFTLPRAVPVRITISNIQGEEVGVLADGIRGAGLHHLTWDGSGFASGVYFCRLVLGDHNWTQKLLLLK